MRPRPRPRPVTVRPRPKKWSQDHACLETLTSLTSSSVLVDCAVYCHCYEGVKRSAGHGEGQHGAAAVSLCQAAVIVREPVNDAAVQVDVRHRS